MLAARSADAAKLAASTATAYGAVIAPISSPARPGPCDLRARPAELELRVPLDELLFGDERREIGLVCDVEEDGERAGDKADDVELPDRHVPDDRGERDGAEGECPPDVRGDEDRPPCEPVDPNARRQREEEEGQHLDRPEEGDTERGRIERDDGDEREREVRDLRAELADRLRAPEAHEVAMAEEARRQQRQAPVVARLR